MIASSGSAMNPGSPTSKPVTSFPEISPSLVRNPTASSLSKPGVRIVTATLTGDLARPAGPDLERLLAGHDVVPDLELDAPDRHHLRAREMARGQVGIELRRHELSVAGGLAPDARRPTGQRRRPIRPRCVSWNEVGYFKP